MRTKAFNRLNSRLLRIEQLTEHLRRVVNLACNEVYRVRAEYVGAGIGNKSNGVRQAANQLTKNERLTAVFATLQKLRKADEAVRFELETLIDTLYDEAETIDLTNGPN